MPYLEGRVPTPPEDGSDPVIEGFDLVITFFAFFGFFVWIALFIAIFAFFVIQHGRRVSAEQWKVETQLRAEREKETEARIASAKAAGEI